MDKRASTAKPEYIAYRKAVLELLMTMNDKFTVKELAETVDDPIKLNETDAGYVIRDMCVKGDLMREKFRKHGDARPYYYYYFNAQKHLGVKQELPHGPSRHRGTPKPVDATQHTPMLDAVADASRRHGFASNGQAVWRGHPPSIRVQAPQNAIIASDGVAAIAQHHAEAEAHKELVNAAGAPTTAESAPPASAYSTVGNHLKTVTYMTLGGMTLAVTHDELRELQADLNKFFGMNR